MEMTHSRELKPVPSEIAKIDVNELVRQIIVLLRGQESQRALSERLGFSFNQVGKWESGVTQISWDDFVHLTKACSIDLESHFRKFFWTFAGNFNSVEVINYLLTDYRFSTGASYRSVDVDRRLRTGATQVMLSEVLKIMAIQPALFFGWISQLVDPEQISEIKSAYEEFTKQVAIVGDNPLAVFVEAAIRLDSYQTLQHHNSQWLARHASCSVAELELTLRTLVDHHIIFFDGSKYHSFAANFSFGSLPNPKLKGLTKYATSLAAERYSTLPKANQNQDLVNKCVSSVRVVAMSKSASEKVAALVQQFHHDVAKIVEADTELKTNVQVCLVHSFASVANAP